MSIYQIQGYEVLDDGKPAVIKGSDIWCKCFYTEFNEALEYAKRWLKDSHGTVPRAGYYEWKIPDNDWQGEPFDYTGFGNMIEIRFQDGIEM